MQAAFGITPGVSDAGKKLKMTLLIVDDNAGIRRILRRVLVDTASTIWECTDGSAALSAYEQHRPDIVLMDIHMPGTDGLTATRQIRGFDPAAQIVVVTDYPDEDIKAAALDAGARTYVLKQEMDSLPGVLSSAITYLTQATKKRRFNSWTRQKHFKKQLFTSPMRIAAFNMR
jgi:CheY-like chemotaxis protein